MRDQFNIRLYRKEDRESIIELFCLNTPSYFAIEEKEDLIEYLAKYIEEYFVIELDNSVLGCGGINFKTENNIKVGVISWDIIHPDYQGLGLGKKLLMFRLKLLKENKNIQKIQVRTSQHVYKYYERMGFKLIEIVEDYWSKGFDLFLMEFDFNEY